MNKTYTMDKEVRNSFKRILKDIEHNAQISWTEDTDDTYSCFTVDCSENVIELVDKLNARLETVNLIVRAKSKLHTELEEITHSLGGKVMKSSKKGYFLITIDRAHQNTFKEMSKQRELNIHISQSMT